MAELSWAGLLHAPNQRTAQALAAGRVKLGQIPSLSEKRCFVTCGFHNEASLWVTFLLQFGSQPHSLLCLPHFSEESGANGYELPGCSPSIPAWNVRMLYGCGRAPGAQVRHTSSKHPSPAWILVLWLFFNAVNPFSGHVPPSMLASVHFIPSSPIPTSFHRDCGLLPTNIQPLGSGDRLAEPQRGRLGWEWE